MTVRIVSPRSETTDRADDAGVFSDERAPAPDPAGVRLLVPDRRGGFRQVGVTSLGADSKVKLYAGFTSIPLERRWLETAIASLRG